GIEREVIARGGGAGGDDADVPGDVGGAEGATGQAGGRRIVQAGHGEIGGGGCDLHGRGGRGAVVGLVGLGDLVGVVGAGEEEIRADGHAGRDRDRHRAGRRGAGGEGWDGAGTGEQEVAGVVQRVRRQVIAGGRCRSAAGDARVLRGVGHAEGEGGRHRGRRVAERGHDEIGGGRRHAEGAGGDEAVVGLVGLTGLIVIVGARQQEVGRRRRSGRD